MTATWTLKFSDRLSFLFSHLYERSFMTPTHLSTLIMFAVLPATLIVSKKKKEVYNHGNHKVTRINFKGLDTTEYCKPGNTKYTLHFGGNGQDSITSHNITDEDQNYVFWNYPRVGISKGLHPLEPNSAYAQFEAGYQQAKRLLTRKENPVSAADLTLNGFSLGGGIATHIARRLHQEGYPVNLTVDRSFSKIARFIPSQLEFQFVDRDCYILKLRSKNDINIHQLPKDYPTLIYVDDDRENIYIYGHAKGKKWALSTQPPNSVSRYTYHERVAYNSPQKISSYLSDPIFKMDIQNKLSLISNEQHSFQQTKYAPFISSMVTLSISGVALGTTFAGLLATTGLSASTALATLGYVIASIIHTIGRFFEVIIQLMGRIIAYPLNAISTTWANNAKAFFNAIAYGVNYPFAAVAYFINEAMQSIALGFYMMTNGLSTMLGGIISFVGALVGSMVGAILGAVASLQLLFTNRPYLMPMTFAFSAALVSSCCEMNSVNQMQRLLATIKRKKTDPTINVINTLDDSVIRKSASLSTGLGISPNYKKKERQAETKPMLNSKRNIFWYKEGDHDFICDQLLFKTSFGR